MLVLDQGLPRSTTLFLHESGIEAVHTGDIGLAAASDGSILEFARKQGRTEVTRDANFHMLLALSDAASPPVIRIRIEGLHAKELARLIVSVLDKCRDDLKRDAIISVTEAGLRLRRVPLIR